MSMTNRLIYAGKWAGVAPWELAEQPIEWLHSIEMCAAAEADVSSTR